ncbi:fimbrial biogenesis chaperone [Aeromonas finlandensis]|uniref:fimbrial biogenesis chaperone n=1 Tax=Aeromonas finlandensis TaxID=1543375 RepID=UPI00067BC27F|nr:molecular chaperone [Aeromonas finlandensis]
MNKSNFIIGLLLSLVAVHSHASISLSATRIIYNGMQKEASINVDNNSDRETAIQTWIEGDGDINQAPPFAVTPPLAKIKGNQRQLLRLFYEGRGLPQDRESVFWLNVQEIPLAVEGENVLQLALMQRIKVFYRPNGLNGEPYLAPEKLMFKSVNNNLEVYNPTPYYINMVSFVNVGGDIKGRMIPPMSKITFSLQKVQPDGKFTLGIVNDFGAVKTYMGELKEGVASSPVLIKP